MNWEMFEIMLGISCFWILWTKKLTDPEDGLLDFMPKYYPLKNSYKIQNLFRCAVCLSGWTALFAGTAYYYIQYTLSLEALAWKAFLLTFVTPCLCAFLVGLIFGRENQ